MCGKDSSEIELGEKETEFQCLSRDIGIQLTSGMEVVLAAGTLIPFRTHHVATLAPEQTAFALGICEAADADQTTLLAKVGLYEI